MLWLGISFGLVAALLQSVSYVVSAGYVRRTGKPGWTLTAPQRVVQALPSLMLAWLFRPAGELRWTPILAAGAISVAMVLSADTGLFQMQRYVEPSRVAPLQAVKIPFVALFSFLAFGTAYGPCQFVGMALVLVSAALLLDAGGRISLRAWLWLFVCTGSYAVSDLSVGHMLFLSRESCGSVFSSSMFVLGLSHAAAGICAVPAFAAQCVAGAARPVGREWLRYVVPYAALWLSAVTFLLVSFSLSGVVLGTIAQSTRGVMSVVLGLVLARHGFADLESRVSRAVFLRRLASAALVVVALVVYSLNLG